MPIRRTKIVATVGPASSSPEMIEALIIAGVNYFRLNFSHGSTEAHSKNIKIIRETASKLDRSIGILADLQGPKIRVGEIEGGSIHLKTGDRLTVTTRQILGNQKEVSTSYLNLPNDVQVGDRFLLDDGLLAFQVKEVNLQRGDVNCEVLYGGLLKSKKGINLPEVNLSAPSLTEQDIENAYFAIENGVDYFALSFVRKPEDVRQLKDLISEKGKSIPVIAKIERREAINCIDAIIHEADGLMVARGDLGVELDMEKVPLIQKQIILKCNRLGKPVITATQMLESMISNPRPTRAEVSDVANAILDGTDAIMLSGETAVGQYPVESINIMTKIAKEIEKNSPILYTRRHGLDSIPNNDIEEAVSLAGCRMAHDLKVKAIIAWTSNGDAIRLLSKFHPVCPIIAITTSERMSRQVELSWGTLSYCGVDHDFFEKDWKTILKVVGNKISLSPGDHFIVAETENHHQKDKINALKVHQLKL